MANGERPPVDVQAISVLEGTHAACVEVFEFLNTVARPIVTENPDRSNLAAVVHGQFIRLLAWTRSLTKLNEPADYQAVGAGCRSLLETAIDLVLLDSADAASRMLAWERSAKLVQANALAAYCRQAGNDPLEYDHILRYAQREGASIDADRRRFGWTRPNGQPRHPSRWTGRDLLADAREADRAGGHQLERFYETRYRELCWSTHGSGAAGLRTIDAEDFPGLSAMAFRDCADLAVQGATSALHTIGAWTDRVQAQFDLLEGRRILAVGLRIRAASQREEEQ